MADREKVIKGLECCEHLSGEYCKLCPYHKDITADTPCWNGALAHDALALLKAQDNALRFIAKVCFGDTDASTIELILRRLAKLGYIDTDGKAWWLKDD